MPIGLRPIEIGRTGLSARLRDGLVIVWQVLLGLLIPAGAGMLAGFALTPLLGPLFGFAAVLIVLVMGRARSAARRQRGLVFLAYVEQAVRLNLPLVQTLRSWASHEQPAMRSSLLRAADVLSAGGSLAEAVRTAAPSLDQRAIDSVYAGERNGQPADAIARALRHEQLRRATIDPTHAPFAKAYAIILLLAIPGITWMLGTFAVPRFEAIFRDFGSTLPPITRTVLTLGTTVMPAVAAVGAIALMIASRQAVVELFRRGHEGRAGFVAAAIDRLRWALPVLGALERDRGLADVCTSVAEAVERQRPLPTAVAEAAQPHLNVVLADRVAAWHEGLERGVSIGSAAREARLPAIMSDLLGTARTPPDVSAVLRFLARYYDARFGRAATLLREAALPALALFGGAAVAAVALAVIAPAVALIELCTGWSGLP